MSQPTQGLSNNIHFRFAQVNAPVEMTTFSCATVHEGNFFGSTVGGYDNPSTPLLPRWLLRESLCNAYRGLCSFSQLESFWLLLPP